MSFKKLLNAIKPCNLLVCATLLKKNDSILQNVSEGSGIGIKKQCKEATRLILRFYEREYKESKQKPACSVAVTFNGETVYKRAFGFMDLESQLPASADMVGDISDVTKLITSHVALALHCDPELSNPGSITGPKEFKFEIFDTIRDYMPRYGPDRVTENWEKFIKGKDWPLWYIMAHMSGVRHYSSFNNENSFAIQQEYAEISESFEMFVEDRLVAYPGRKQIYSGYAFNILGYIIERHTEVNFSDTVCKEMCRLNLNNTMGHYFDNVPYKTMNNYYMLDDATTCNKKKLVNGSFFDYTYNMPSRGVMSTVGDLTKFADMYMRAKQGVADSVGPIPTKWVLRMMSRRAGKMSDSSEAIGLGWFIKSRKTFKHTKDGLPFYYNTYYHKGIGNSSSCYLSTSELSTTNFAASQKENEECAKQAVASKLTSEKGNDESKVKQKLTLSNASFTNGITSKFQTSTNNADKKKLSCVTVAIILNDGEKDLQNLGEEIADVFNNDLK